MIGTDLSDFKKKLVDERIETSSQIKSSVFKNFKKFIETAKEISRKFFVFLYNFKVDWTEIFIFKILNRRCINFHIF